MKVVFTNDEALAKSDILEEDFLVELAQCSGESIRSKIEQGDIKAVRLASPDYLCDILDCEPGDLLRKVSDR